MLAAILVRTINANSDEFKDGCHLKRVKDTKTGVASTALQVHEEVLEQEEQS